MSRPPEDAVERRPEIRRALLSVYDKQGIVEFARTLAEAGVEMVSSGGTAGLLSEHGVPIKRIEEVTGFPELLGGRVKTLHPKIHGGILAIRDDEAHRRDLERLQIEPIDLVVVNLYPFETTAQREGARFDELIEMIDIGGPTLVRAAAKNHRDVGVVVDPRDYSAVASEIRSSGALSDVRRFELARKAFAHTAAYDAAIVSHWRRRDADGSRREESSCFPDEMTMTLRKLQELRYGENPHQRAALYGEPDAGAFTLARAEQVHGAALSFNNLLDLDGALAAALSLDGCGCVIVKHGNPCGAALGETPAAAFEAAREGDPVSAFGGIVAFNRSVDLDAANAVSSLFLEAVIAPDYAPDAAARLARKKKLRVLRGGDPLHPQRPGFDVRRISGGFLLQDWDSDDDLASAQVVTRREPTNKEWAALRFGCRVCRHVRSNAIVFTGSDRTFGVGAGQMSRVDAVKLAAMKAGERSRGAVMASDAFFPFRDGIDEAAGAGIRAIIQPGGSIRDQEVIEAADEHDLAMVFSGRRHFRH
ncbi:MAG: bifunctional phosphoribosylaminoimidazolecarboxamide formyltransferase/IMP cyclohydrolase [Acidobacteriota bacterium]|nr:MAG: bifunctional phosphoribosylaminoimidazolecarboxamide formyltransferase/IMP cyclohydrolase [Acidobacteriota bacterium]